MILMENSFVGFILISITIGMGLFMLAIKLIWELLFKKIYNFILDL